MLVLESSKAQMIHALHKDETIIRDFRKKIAESLLDWCGPRVWLEEEVDMVSRLLYLVPTMMSQHATLGEEWVDIYPLVFSQGTPPNKMRCALLLYFLVVVPYTYKVIRKRARISRPNPRGAFLVEWVKWVWNSTVRLCKNVQNQQRLTYVDQFNTMCFFYYGRFLTLSHRLMDIRFVQKRKPISADGGYVLLGHFLLIRFILVAIQYKTKSKSNGSERLRQSREEEEEEVESKSSNSFGDCRLCLAPMQSPSVTACGHVFCWNCIMEWTTKKSECPICRAVTLPQQTIPCARYQNIMDDG